tara:strand:- start:2577 stop:2759 length:183 start_codon:yes stop_codon:yes gene_type:complete
LFFLAETLGTTVNDLAERLSVSEFLEWHEYFKIKNEAEKKAMEKSRAKSKSRSPRSFRRR